MGGLQINRGWNFGAYCEKDTVRNSQTNRHLAVVELHHKRIIAEGHVVPIISMNDSGAPRRKEIDYFSRKSLLLHQFSNFDPACHLASTSSTSRDAVFGWLRDGGTALFGSFSGSILNSRDPASNSFKA
jgi:hypothetical protein